jgi:ankyrin repeat protein
LDYCRDNLTQAKVERVYSWVGKLNFWTIRRCFSLVIVFIAETHEGQPVKIMSTLRLLSVAEEGRKEEIIICLENGVEIDSRNNGGLSTVMVATREGHEPIVSFLLQNNANIEAVTPYRWTALFYAASSNSATHDSASMAALLTLLKNNAKVTAVAESGLTALLQAAFNGRQAAVAILLENNADTEAALEVSYHDAVYSM